MLYSCCELFITHHHHRTTIIPPAGTRSSPPHYPLLSSSSVFFPKFRSLLHFRSRQAAIVLPAVELCCCCPPYPLTGCGSGCNLAFARAMLAHAACSCNFIGVVSRCLCHTVFWLPHFEASDVFPIRTSTPMHWQPLTTPLRQTKWHRVQGHP